MLRITLHRFPSGPFACVNVEDRRLIVEARERLDVAFRILRDSVPGESRVPSGFCVIAEAPTVRFPLEEPT